MGYFGSKATSGLCQALIALMPPHSVYIESHLGGGALMKRKPTGVRSIGIDRDAQALEAFACDYPVWCMAVPMPFWPRSRFWARSWSTAILRMNSPSPAAESIARTSSPV